MIGLARKSSIWNCREYECFGREEVARMVMENRKTLPSLRCESFFSQFASWINSKNALRIILCSATRRIQKFMRFDRCRCYCGLCVCCCRIKTATLSKQTWAAKASREQNVCDIQFPKSPSCSPSRNLHLRLHPHNVSRATWSKQRRIPWSVLESCENR